LKEWSCGKRQREVVDGEETRVWNEGRINYACRGHCLLVTVFVLKILLKENEET
jgi:hypothetical protein